MEKGVVHLGPTTPKGGRERVWAKHEQKED